MNVNQKELTTEEAMTYVLGLAVGYFSYVLVPSNDEGKINDGFGYLLEAIDELGFEDTHIFNVFHSAIENEFINVSHIDKLMSALVNYQPVEMISWLNSNFKLLQATL